MNWVAIVCSLKKMAPQKTLILMTTLTETKLKRAEDNPQAFNKCDVTMLTLYMNEGADAPASVFTTSERENEPPSSNRLNLSRGGTNNQGEPVSNP